jgi:hypothetical protein
MFGVNPWTLNSWMGHKSMEETMRYVHVAEHHHRQVPDAIIRAGQGEMDVGKRVIAMLGARGAVIPNGDMAATAGVEVRDREGFRAAG